MNEEEKEILGGDSGKNAEMENPAERMETTVLPKEEKTESATTEESPQFSKMIGENGAFAENWRALLPENIRNEKCLDPIKTFGTLVQSYVHAQKAIGANKVAIPSEHSGKSEWDAFYKAIGRPDSEEGYSSEGVEIPSGIALDESQLANFRKFAFENGINQKTFQALLAYDIKRCLQKQQEDSDAHNAEYEETLSRLQNEYGNNFEKIIAQCNKTMQTFGITDLMREKKLLNNFTMIKALASIGEKIGESRIKGSMNTSFIADPESQLSSIRNNPDDPYYKKDHPAHRDRVSEVNRILALLAASRSDANQKSF